jgi:hypothetical protein
MPKKSVKKAPLKKSNGFKVRRTEERYLALSTLVQMARESDLGDPELEDWAYGILDGSTTGTPPSLEAARKRRDTTGEN